MLATINEFLFPMFLFFIYFYAISATLTLHSGTSIADGRTSEPISTPDSDSVINAPSAEKEIAPVPDEKSRESEREDDFLVRSEILIDKLTKRSCRKICKSLGIRQKRGKTEKPLTSVKTEIRELFRENPARVRSVIEANLPELLPAPGGESGIA